MRTQLPFPMRPPKPPMRVFVERGACPPWSRAGKARTAILLWLLGIPIPIIILIFLVKGCVT